MFQNIYISAALHLLDLNAVQVTCKVTAALCIHCARIVYYALLSLSIVAELTCIIFLRRFWSRKFSASYASLFFCVLLVRLSLTVVVTVCFLPFPSRKFENQSNNSRVILCRKIDRQTDTHG